MAFELAIVAPDGRQGASLFEIAETLSSFPEIARDSELTWQARIHNGGVLRLYAEVDGCVSAEVAANRIESLVIEAPTPLEAVKTRALLSLAFAISRRLDWRVFEQGLLGEYLDSERLDFWVWEFTGYCEEQGPTGFDKGFAACLALKLPVVAVAAALAYGSVGLALVYADAPESWLQWLIPIFGTLSLCMLLGVMSALVALRHRVLRTRPLNPPKRSSKSN